MKILESFHPREALGLLARAALALTDEGNPAAEALLKNEYTVRKRILAEARKSLGISPRDETPEAREQVADLLDKEADRLIGPDDQEAALKRLAESGDLPSDLYEINIVTNVKEHYGKHFPLNEKIIKATIRSPDKEQHFGRTKSKDEPILVSLFCRHFNTKWPFKNFTMLVAASRSGLLLEVHQAWRIYAPIQQSPGPRGLVDILSSFADVYGAEINVDGRIGHFFLTTNQASYPEIQFQLKDKTNFTISMFTNDQAEGKAALVCAIDLKKYAKLLKRMHVDEEEILTPINPKNPSVKMDS